MRSDIQCASCGGNQRETVRCGVCQFKFVFCCATCIRKQRIECMKDTKSQPPCDAQTLGVAAMVLEALKDA